MATLNDRAERYTSWLDRPALFVAIQPNALMCHFYAYSSTADCMAIGEIINMWQSGAAVFWYGFEINSEIVGFCPILSHSIGT